MKLYEKVLSFAKKEFSKTDIDIFSLSRKITEIYESELLSLYKRELGDIDGICLIGFGSFGRRMMAPLSDLDFAILVSSKKIRAKHKKKIENFIACVWDILKKVEYSVRTPEETINIALEDIRVLSYLGDIRFISGDVRVFQELLIMGRELMKSHVQKIFSMLKNDRALRITKRQYSLLEPDVKSSPGGISDYVYVTWLQKLVSEDILVSLSDIRNDLRRLLEVRFALHISRKNDVLHTSAAEDVLKIIKEKWGINMVGKRAGLNELMTSVIKHMHKIKVYADIAERYLMDRVYPITPTYSDRLGKFRTNGTYIYLDEEELKNEPELAVEIFKVAKENNLDLSPETSYMLIKMRKLRNLHKNQSAWRYFYEILREPGGVGRILVKMWDTGILERLIPEFRRVSNLWQIVPPHVYPVGLHLIKCVEWTERILSGMKPDYVEFLPEIQEKDVVLISAFLHDIAKGDKKDHSELGEEWAERIGRRMVLSGEKLERIKFLVRHHLSLSSFAQRRDIHDNASLTKFSSMFPDLISLDSLYILSLADAIATNPENWNSWKAYLIAEIYVKTSERIRKGLDFREDEHTDALMLSDELSEFFPRDIVELFISSLSQKFLSFFSYDRLFRYSCAFLNAYMSGKRYAAFTKRDEGVIEVITIGDDVPGFLCECAGMLFLAGFNILSLYAEGGLMGKALNIFWVEPPETQRMEKFKKLFSSKRLEDIIHEIEERRKKIINYLVSTNPFVRENTEDSVRVIFDNETSENFTIVEVYCFDRPALLFDIAYTITMSGYDISVAKISTRENKVADIFYIRKKEGDMGKLNQSEFEKLGASIKRAIIRGIPRKSLRMPLL